MTSLESLRTRLVTPERQALLDEIWQHYLAHDEWITRRQLHHPRRASEVRTALETLGGAIVWDNGAADGPRYQLTFLGVLLTSQGQDCEHLLVSYLRFARQCYEQDFTTQAITWEQAATALSLSQTQAKLLSKLIMLSNFCSNSSQSGEMWSVGLPSDIDRYPLVPESLRILVHERALQHYAPDIPIDADARMQFMYRPSQAPASPAAASGSDVFVVHGHDDEAKLRVARFLERIGLRPIILHEQASGGRTIIEKVEYYANVRFAVVILTPDDIGASKRDAANLRPRARQNVIFELGYFIARLGRDRVCPLLKSGLDRPTDIDGVVYISMDDGEG